MDTSPLEDRLTRLEDIEAIRQLKARYCEICDDNHDPELIVSVFAEDAIWEARGIGHAEGHEAIRTLFRKFQQSISFSQHMTMNPRIEVNGERATGVWYFFGPFTMRKGNRAVWQAARYHEEYVKQAGDWKISHLKVAGPAVSADYQTGWAR
jgi:ketosteroid isomerase-like protein